MANFKVIWLSNNDSYTFPLSGIHELTPYLFFTRLINHKFRTEHGYEDWLNNMEKQKNRFLRVQYLDQEDELIDLGAAPGEFESFKSCVFAITKKNPLFKIFVSFDVKEASDEKIDLFSKVMKMEKKEKPVKDVIPSEKEDDTLTSNKLTKSRFTEYEIPDWLKSYLNQFKENFMNEVLEKVKSTIGTSEKLAENNKSAKLKGYSECNDELYNFFRESFFLLTDTVPQEGVYEFEGFYCISSSPYNIFVYAGGSVSIKFAFIFECGKLFDSQIMPYVTTRDSKTNKSIVLQSNCEKNIKRYRFIIYTLQCSANNVLGPYYQHVNISVNSIIKKLDGNIPYRICTVNRGNYSEDVNSSSVDNDNDNDNINKVTNDDDKLIILTDDDDKLNKVTHNDDKKERRDVEYCSDLESCSSGSMLNDSVDFADVNSVELFQLPQCFSAHKYSHEEMLPVFVKKNETVEENPSVNLLEKSPDDIESNSLVDVHKHKANGTISGNIWTDVENCFGSTENVKSSFCSINQTSETKTSVDENNPENLNEFIDKSIPILPESVINVASTVIGNILKPIKVPQKEEVSKDVLQKLTDLVESKENTIDRCLEMVIQNNLNIICGCNDSSLPSLESRISDYFTELLTIPGTKLSEDKKKLISIIANYSNEQRNSKSKIVLPKFLLKEVIQLIKFNLCNLKYILPS